MQTHACGALTRTSNAGYGAGIAPLTELPLVAAGGTSSVQLYCDAPAGYCDHSCPLARFDRPLDVEVLDGPVWFAGMNRQHDPVFFAAAAGTGHLRFVAVEDGYVYAEGVVARAAELDTLSMTRIKTEREPEDLPIVLATQHSGPHFDVELLSAARERLVDDSLAMRLPPGAEIVGKTEIDLFGVASGLYSIEFRAAGKTFVELVEVANEADLIELWSAPATIPREPITPGTQEYVCFLAKNAGRYVTGLRWQHTVDGVVQGAEWSHGCVEAATGKPTGTLVTFTATAGGRSSSVQIPAR